MLHGDYYSVTLYLVHFGLGLFLSCPCKIQLMDIEEIKQKGQPKEQANQASSCRRWTTGLLSIHEYSIALVKKQLLITQESKNSLAFHVLILLLESHFSHVSWHCSTPICIFQNTIPIQWNDHDLFWCQISWSWNNPKSRNVIRRNQKSSISNDLWLIVYNSFV